ncbi:MAG: hypothetical protein ABIP49_08090 [Lysobacterales bacterium]
MDIRTGYFKRCLIALLASLALPALAVTEVTGTTPGGASYRIALPDGWQAGGPLVLMQHGYNHEPNTNPSLGPLRETQLAAGYAIAASGYRQSGWALFTALDDNAELLAEFTRRYGAPGALYAVGGSMGGLISLKLAEDPRFRSRTLGVLAFCPVVAGVEAWDQAFDLRLIYDSVCDGVAVGELPDGDPPYPWAYNLRDIPDDPGDLDPGNLDLLRALVPVAQCTGLGLPDVLRSSAQRVRLAQIKDTSGVGNEDFLITQLAYATFGLGDLVRSPDKLAGRNPFFNEVQHRSEVRALRYLPNAVNNAIRRVRQADPFARFDFERSSSLDGNATARIVTLRTDRDELVSGEHRRFLEAVYPSRSGELLSADRQYATVRETTPSHCGFTAAEAHAGWDSMRVPALVESTLPSRCAAREAAGYPGPCRFAPLSATAEFTNVIDRGYQIAAPIRSLTVAETSSGFWYDAARSGEGIVIEELGLPIGYGKFAPASVRRVLVSWYTFAPPSDPEPGPRWLTGVGFQTGQGVHVPSMTITRGARFGAAFNSADVERRDWGSLSLVVDAQHRLQLRYSGPPGWEGSQRAMTLLAALDFDRRPVPCCLAGLLDPPPPDAPLTIATASGSYFNAARDGEGIQLQVIEVPGSTRQRAVIVFYTYDSQGRQLWLVGAAENVPAGGGDLVFEVVRAEGAVFGDAFDSAAVRRIPWGTLTVTIAPVAEVQIPENMRYHATRLRWNSLDPAYGNGGYALTRLTAPTVSGSGG